MIGQLTRHEDSWAVVIEQPMIDLLEITTDGKVLTITPVSEPILQSEFEAALEQTNREFGAVLRRLAE